MDLNQARISRKVHINCQCCGKQFEIGRRHSGRRPKFCSSACKQAQFRNGASTFGAPPHHGSARYETPAQAIEIAGPLTLKIALVAAGLWYGREVISTDGVLAYVVRERRP